MKPERRKKEFQRMYEELTDPKLQEEARMRTERDKRKEEKKTDAGL